MTAVKTPDELNLNPPNTPVTMAPEKGQSGSENCLALGTRLAEFEITGIIGEGGFGIVYQAFDHSLRRTVAIKEYMPNTLAARGPENSVVVRSKKQRETFDTGLKSFIHEARLLARFDHPALIKVYRFWEENQTGYMAMRCYQGVTLKSIVENENAPVTEAWLKDLLRPLLEALDALYQVQILHRDISPDNIIIQSSGEPVLLDFGAARQIISDMTQALTVILKPGYAPIEQYADDASMKQGPWTDIYSLSAVVYSLITRKLPPTSVARMIKDPIEALASGGFPGFSTNFLVAIDKGLAVRPEHRPQSIEEFRNLLGIETEAPVRPAAVVPLAPAREDAGTRSAPDPKAKRHAKHKAAEAAPAQTRRVEPKRSGLGGKLAWAAVVAGIMIIGGSSGYLLVKRGSETRAADAAAVPFASKPAPMVASASAGSATERAAATDGERNAWEALYDENPVKPESINKFLRKYPSGKYATLARAKLAELNAAKQAPGKTPEATEQKTAAQGEETVAWDELTRDADPRPARLRAFIRRFPNSPHLALARARLAELQAQRAAQAKSAQPDEKAAGENAARTGKAVRINVRPWGNVLLDGTEKGVSPPLKKLMIPEGKHQVRIVNPSFPDYVIDIDTSKKKLESIEYDFSLLKK